MSGFGKLWTFLSNPQNRGVLAFLGAGLAAVVAGAWQVYVHFTPSPAPAPPQAAPTVQVMAAPAGAADVNAAERLAASDNRALSAETSALDKVSQQIEDANKPPSSASGARH